MQYVLDGIGASTNDKDKPKDISTVFEFMGKEVHFSCQEHKASFGKLTSRQQQFISVYMRTGSPRQVAIELGLSGSIKGVSKRLTQIAKLMGLTGVRELRGGVRPESTATAKELKKKAETQSYRCALSGRKIDPNNAQLDHIIPLSSGGDNSIDNLQWLESQVNKAKGTMSQEEFIRMCKQVAQWNS